MGAAEGIGRFYGDIDEVRISNTIRVPVWPPVTAAFTAFPISGNAPHLVNFTDQSTGDILGWNWVFGDGSTSTAQNPTHYYNAPGDYTVSLSVVGSGNNDTHTKIAYIQVSTQILLASSPTIVAPSESVTASWLGLTPTGNDWISMHPFNDPDSSYLSWQYAPGASGSLVFTAPAQPGWYNFRLFRNGTKVATSNPFQVQTLLSTVPPADFDGNGSTDVSVFRPSNGRWYTSTAGLLAAYGIAGDIPVPQDYDGDGDTDIAVYRPSNGRWYFYGGSSAGFGIAGDIPMPCDYDGDGDADIAIYRPSNGRWYVSGQGYTAYGIAGDIPVPGDYDGDGDCDVAIYRPSNGRWYVKDQGYAAWGIAGDIPVPGDYDGDGNFDIAIYRPSNGRWYVLGQGYVAYGIPGDIPVPGDYDGDGSWDQTIYRPSNGRWYMYGIGYEAFGIAGDYPLPARDTNIDGDPHE
ncbi:MAG: PKD domain-containing protein [Chloroflexi bacterium]|nr:PKD domain-containing protein [Chloroflexota bacterium]